MTAVCVGREAAGSGAQGTEGERAVLTEPPRGRGAPRPTVTLRGIIFSLMGRSGSVGGRRERWRQCIQGSSPVHCDAYITPPHNITPTSPHTRTHNPPDGDLLVSHSLACRGFSFTPSPLALRGASASFVSSTTCLGASVGRSASSSSAPPASHSLLRWRYLDETCGRRGVEGLEGCVSQAGREKDRQAGMLPYPTHSD